MNLTSYYNNQYYSNSILFVGSAFGGEATVQQRFDGWRVRAKEKIRREEEEAINATIVVLMSIIGND